MAEEEVVAVIEGTKGKAEILEVWDNGSLKEYQVRFEGADGSLSQPGHGVHRRGRKGRREDLRRRLGNDARPGASARPFAFRTRRLTLSQPSPSEGEGLMAACWSPAALVSMRGHRVSEAVAILDGPSLFARGMSYPRRSCF